MGRIRPRIMPPILNGNGLYFRGPARTAPVSATANLARVRLLTGTGTAANRHRFDTAVGVGGSEPAMVLWLLSHMGRTGVPAAAPA